MTGAGADRRPVRQRRGGTTRLTFLGPTPDPPFERVTSAAVVAVADDGRLVLAALDRGPDIPGGHVQHGETAIEQTVRREAWEEVRARLGTLLPVEVVESDYFGEDDLSYMVIRAARVTELAPWEAYHESAGRLLLTPEEFLARYRGRPGFMDHLVTRALAVLSGAATAADDQRPR